MTTTVQAGEILRVKRGQHTAAEIEVHHAHGGLVTVGIRDGTVEVVPAQEDDQDVIDLWGVGGYEADTKVMARA